MPDQVPEEVDVAYKLIGEFVVVFSTFVEYLTIGLNRCVGTQNPKTNEIMWAIAGNIGADQVLTNFFSAAAVVHEHAPEEDKIRKEIRKRARALIEARNAMAHGMWALHTSSESGTQVDPLILRTKATGAGIEHRTEGGFERLRSHIDEAKEVCDLVWSYISGLFTYPVLAAAGTGDEGMPKGLTDVVEWRDTGLVPLWGTFRSSGA